MFLFVFVWCCCGCGCGCTRQRQNREGFFRSRHRHAFRVDETKEAYKTRFPVDGTTVEVGNSGSTLEMSFATKAEGFECGEKRGVETKPIGPVDTVVSHIGISIVVGVGVDTVVGTSKDIANQTDPFDTVVGVVHFQDKDDAIGWHPDRHGLGHGIEADGGRGILLFFVVGTVVDIFLPRGGTEAGGGYPNKRRGRRRRRVLLYGCCCCCHFCCH